MKFLILFLFFSSSLLAQDYSKLFNSLDSLQKKEVYTHLRKVKKLINYEIIKKEGTIKKNDFIKGVFFIDSQGKFSLIIIDENSKKYEEIISNVTSKLPNAYCSNYFNQYVSFRFKLIEINNLETFNFKLLNDEQNVPQAFSEISTYPSFKKHSFLNDKEKSLDAFHKSMNKHIEKNFSYPRKAIEENIEGRTIVVYLISSEGNVDEIYAYNADPLLQIAGIKIIEMLPKLIPATTDGEEISVIHSQPFTFKLQ